MQTENPLHYTQKDGLKQLQQNLVRHSESGRYYARIWSNGKEVWKSLKTPHFSVAEARLSKYENEQPARVDVEVARADATITLGKGGRPIICMFDLTGEAR